MQVPGCCILDTGYLILDTGYSKYKFIFLKSSIQRPVSSIYSKDPKKAYAMSIKTKYLIILVMLGIIDVVIPIPILGVILIYVVLQRPPWFTNVVREIYNIE
jgi:hypothetical protein